LLVQWAILKSWGLPQAFITTTSNKNAPLTLRQIIRYLLKRRFPDLDLIEASIGDYGQRTEEVDIYLIQLKKYSRTELVAQYDAEQQSEKLLREQRLFKMTKFSSLIALKHKRILFIIVVRKHGLKKKLLRLVSEKTLNLSA
jgi:hypothetical protein